MAEWLIEQGIGETRALLLEGDTALAAKLHWPGELTAGQLHDGKLTFKTSGSRRGIATLDNGAEVLIDHLPSDLTEGAKVCGAHFSRGYLGAWPPQICSGTHRTG